MKRIKNILKNSQLMQLIALFAVIFAINVFAMNMAEKAEQAAALNIMKQSSPAKDMEDTSEDTQHKNQYFIFEQGTDNGIWVDRKLAKENSESIKSMIEDLGGEPDEIKIPLPCSIDTIKLAFHVLNKKIKDLNKLSLEQIISIANLFNFLDVPSDTMNIVLTKIKEDIEKSNEDNVYETLKELHPDLQKLLMVDSSITCLKNCMMMKYANNRKQPLIGHEIDIRSVAFSPDNTKIVSSSFGLPNNNNLILWDISDPNNITHKPIEGPQIDIVSVAFSPDGTKFASGSYGDQNNLIVWDISDPNNIINYVLAGHPMAVFSVAFSPDGKHIISGCAGHQDNLILWDISDLNNITHQVIEGCPADVVRSVAFSPDSTKCAAGCEGNQDNIIIWNMHNLTTPQVVEKCPNTVNSIAFSPDNTKIVAGCSTWGTDPNLIVFDISKPNNMKPILEKHLKDNVQAVVFSPDGTKIISGSRGKMNNLIIWNIKDLDNITYQTLTSHTIGVISVAMSLDNKHMVSCGYDDLILWTLLTNQEEQLLNQLKNYTSDQVRLIYQLCLQSSKKQIITLPEDSAEYITFMTLPQDMRDLLTDLLITKSGWLSNLWQTFIQRKI